ncbi:hypothetical protein KUCAC02_013422 [Chaenocephalus aceratus]|nr:hypothetical protein KUCAC02_013422 [Chaenocephalus aceratus]
MKRVRTEQIQCAVTQYLKRRQYVETDGSLKGAKLFQSAEEMAASLSVQTESGCANIVSAAPCQSEPQQYEAQFSRLRSFLSETEISWAKEVSGLLYPLFVYLHLDLVHCGLKGAVDGFYSRFHTLFLQDSEQRATIEQLRHVLTSQDVAANPKLSAFLEHKYVVHLTEPAYSYLLRYLQSEDNSAICRALNTHLQVEWRDCCPNPSSSWAVVDGVEGGDVWRFLQGSLRSKWPSRSLQDCIKKVCEGPPTLTTVCFLRLPQHGAHAEHGGGFRRQPAALRRIRQLHREAVEPESQEAEKPNRIRSTCRTFNLACDEEEEDGFPAARSRRCEVTAARCFARPFLTDSSGLLSCFRDTTVRYWDLGQLTNTALYRGHAYPVWDVDLSPCSLLLRQRVPRPHRTPLDVLPHRHQPVLQPRQQPGGLVLYRQLGAGGGTIRNSHGAAPADGSSNEMVGLYTGNTSNVLNVQFMACNLLLVSGTAQEKTEQ